MPKDSTFGLQKDQCDINAKLSNADMTMVMLTTLDDGKKIIIA